MHETVQAITEALGPGMAAGCVCNVSKEEEVEELLKTCWREFNQLDICYANAGITGSFEFLTDIQKDNMHNVFDVNVGGVLLLFKHVAKRWVEMEQPGSLIATASVAGVRSGAGDSVYRYSVILTI